MQHTKRRKVLMMALASVVVLWAADVYTDCVPRAAAGALRQMVKVTPNWENGYDALGWVYLSCQDHEKADKAFGRSYSIALKNDVERDPNDAQAHFDLARHYHYGEEGNVEQAIEHYKAAVQIDANYAGAWVFLGHAYEETGHYDKAMESYEEAVRIDCEDSYACESLVGVCKKAIGTHPENPNAHYSLGKAHLQMGKTDLALQEYAILKDLGSELAEELHKLISEE